MGKDIAGDRALRGHKGKKHGIHETGHIRQRERWERNNVEIIYHSMPKVDITPITLKQLIDDAGLTPKQTKAVKLYARFANQTWVAVAMGVKQPEISRLLGRAKDKLIRR